MRLIKCQHLRLLNIYVQNKARTGDHFDTTNLYKNLIFYNRVREAIPSLYPSCDYSRLLWTTAKHSNSKMLWTLLHSTHTFIRLNFYYIGTSGQFVGANVTERGPNSGLKQWNHSVSKRCFSIGTNGELIAYLPKDLEAVQNMGDNSSG